jgi:hypothetical protein
METNWLEFAQKPAANARAGLAVERQRLEKILAEQKDRQQPPQQQRFYHPANGKPSSM